MTRRNYDRGYESEDRAVKDLTALGFTAWRSHASRGPFDVYACRFDKALLVQVKRTKHRIVSPAAVETEFKADLVGDDKHIGIYNIQAPDSVQRLLYLWSDRGCGDLKGWRFYLVEDRRLIQMPDYFV